MPFVEPDFQQISGTNPVHFEVGFSSSGDGEGGTISDTHMRLHRVLFCFWRQPLSSTKRTGNKGEEGPLGDV